jgi:hypothetical protein
MVVQARIFPARFKNGVVDEETALVRRGSSLSIEGLASEATLKIIEVDFDALDQYQAEISALAPNALICALGTTIRKAGSNDAFARVDRDYVAAFAALGRAAGANQEH